MGTDPLCTVPFEAESTSVFVDNEAPLVLAGAAFSPAPAFSLITWESEKLCSAGGGVRRPDGILDSLRPLWPWFGGDIADFASCEPSAADAPGAGRTLEWVFAQTMRPIQSTMWREWGMRQEAVEILVHHSQIAPRAHAHGRSQLDGMFVPRKRDHLCCGRQVHRGARGGCGIGEVHEVVDC
jgi:hypothetical protein